MSKSKPDPLAWISPPLRAFAVPIAELTPDPGNARRHPTYNLEAIRRSLERFGQQKPIVCSADRIVRCGNGTMAAALAAGRTMIAAVISDLSPAEIEAYAIADNRSGELAEWDPEKLKAALGRMPADLQAAAGWDGDALRKAMGIADEPEEGPEPDQSEPVTRSGDLWVLGGHRLLCGDSTDEATVRRVMGGQLAEFVFTDPPYGVKYEGGMKPGQKTWTMLENDDEVNMYAASLPGIKAATSPKAPVYLTFASTKSRSVYAAIHEAGYEPRAMLIWNKHRAQHGAIGAQYKQKHEPILYMHRRGHSPHWFGPATEVTVWDIDRSARNEFHPTEKPVELVARAMRNSAPPGCICYEPFSGSGTTIITAEQLGRRCFAIELDPRYVDVAVNRWETLTGQRATLEDGTDPRTAPR